MALRWIGLPLQASMLRLGFEPGGVGVLGCVFPLAMLNDLFLENDYGAMWNERRDSLTSYVSPLY